MDLQDSHDANLRLLFAEGFRCEAAILRGRGARLSSLRSPDLRLGLQEQSLCRRRPGLASQLGDSIKSPQVLE